MTNLETSDRRNGDGKGLSQAIFVLIALGIIVGGLWSLYFSDAPYHPQNDVSRSDTQLIGD